MYHLHKLFSRLDMERMCHPYKLFFRLICSKGAGDSSQLAEGDDAEVPVAEFLDDPEWVDGRDDPS